MEISHDGQFLFTVNTGPAPLPLPDRPRRHADPAGQHPGRRTGVGAVDARLSPDGRFLFVDESAVGAVAAFAVNGGGLTELATSPFPLPAGAAPAGIVVN